MAFLFKQSPDDRQVEEEKGDGSRRRLIYQRQIRVSLTITRPWR
jgi:hypothetical protein